MIYFSKADRFSPEPRLPGHIQSAEKHQGCIHRHFELDMEQAKSKIQVMASFWNRYLLDCRKSGLWELNYHEASCRRFQTLTRITETGKVVQKDT